ncbi:MAG: EAL domain-containing protein [Alphaproteobacteria bacterium]
MVLKSDGSTHHNGSGALFDLAMALNADKAPCPTDRRRPAKHLNVDQELAASDRDPLTGYLSRIGLAAALEKEQQNRDNPCTFMLAGINRLALVNEAYGIDVADELIVATAGRLKEALRKTDILGRYAGNKFGIILRDSDEKQMRETADRLLSIIGDRAIELKAGVIPVAISLGGVVVQQKSGGAREAMLQAEEALSQARTRYIGDFQIFQPSELRETERRRNIKLSDEIVCALNDRRMTIAKQPIVSATTGKVDFHECLVRMIRTNGSVVAAGEFVPAAEKLGLTRYLDHRVLGLVIESLFANPHETYSLNVSVPTALLSNEWYDTLKSAVSGRRDLARRLIVEITETVAITDVEESIRFVADLRSLGCRVAIDDFGAGYTSFRNLKLLDVDMVKIDGAFIKNLSNSPDDQVFVRTLIDLARNFNLVTVAEWVNSAADAEVLRSWGVDYFQGFMFGEPVLDQPVQDTQASKKTNAGKA